MLMDPRSTTQKLNITKIAQQLNGNFLRIGAKITVRISAASELVSAILISLQPICWLVLTMLQTDPFVLHIAANFD